MNNEEVGKISYSVEIDVSALKAGTKSAEQAVKSSFGNTEKTITSSVGKSQQAVGSFVTTLGALTAAILALRSTTKVLTASIDAANKYQASMLGLESVARSFIGDTEAATAAARALSSDGLLPLADAATGLKNLLAAGYGLDDAIVLMERFKDSAAFGRQGSLQFGEAVRTATEGIKNGNSILVDNAGVTKNLSVILQEAGFSAQDMQHASTNLGVRMAILNGIIRETNPQLGDAARLADTAAGSDAKLAFATNELQIKIGDLANALRQDLTNSITDFVAGNQDFIISMGAGTTAAGLFAGGIYAVSKAIGVLRAGLTLLARHPAIAILAATAGILASVAVGDYIKDLEKAQGSTKDIEEDTAKTDVNMANVNKQTADLAKKLAKVGEQTAKVRRDYREQLAELVKTKRETISTLEDQLKDERKTYEKAVSDRAYDFEVEQQKEEDAHFSKTKALQNQINFLQKYNTASNKKQLSELQFSLARENAEFTKRNDERKLKYDQDAAHERSSYEQRKAELQARLTEERKLLEKHRNEVNSIRNVILLDEIEKLKRSRDEQLKSLQEQTANLQSELSKQNAIIDQNNNKRKQKAKKDGEEEGKAQAKGFRDGYAPVFKEIAKANERLVEANKKGDTKGAQKAYQDFLKAPLNIPGRASGGSVGAGLPYFVGENSDGSINRTTELFVPKTSGTIVPADEVQKAMGGGGGNSYTINIPISGAIVSSPQDQRRFAEVIGKRLNEIMIQKGLKPLIGEI